MPVPSLQTDRFQMNRCERNVLHVDAEEVVVLENLNRWRESQISVRGCDFHQKKICPDVGCSSKLRQRKNVLFPEPDGPTTTIRSPFSIVVLMSLRTRLSPKAFERFLTSITASQPPLKLSQNECQPQDECKINQGNSEQRLFEIKCLRRDVLGLAC